MSQNIETVYHDKGGITMEYQWKKWLKAAGIRAIRTFGQTLVAMIPAAVSISAVDWLTVLGTGALAAVVSLATSVAGLPELKETDHGSDS
jgi:hypothetical protein